jgi:hypothetical protein
VAQPFLSALAIAENEIAEAPQFAEVPAQQPERRSFLAAVIEAYRNLGQFILSLLGIS